MVSKVTVFLKIERWGRVSERERKRSYGERRASIKIRRAFSSCEIGILSCVSTVQGVP